MTRYAIYFTPVPGSPLDRFGSGVLGYDAVTGQNVPFLDHAALHAVPCTAGGTVSWADLTTEPRRYGFHATLHAPFELTDDCGEVELLSAVETFAASRGPIEIGLALTSHDGYFALAPTSGHAVLSRLSQSCVEHFDRFRRPLTPSDHARRSQRLETARQRDNLARWGYPWVGEDFAFHMTLTGVVPIEHHAIVKGALADLYGREQNLVLDAISLCRQADRATNFRVMRRVLLGPV